MPAPNLTWTLLDRPRREKRGLEGEPDAKAVLRSVLRSMENIAPGIPPSLSGRITPDPITRGAPGRYTMPNPRHQPPRPPSAATDV